MKAVRIKSTDDKYFDPVWEIYNTSFPSSERRVLEHQKIALKNKLYHLDCYIEDDKAVGLLAYWDFPDYLYIEHFAINSALRSGGYGSRILRSLLGSTQKTVIIEIDPQIDDISVRRRNFYERLGFIRNPYVHPTPNYQPEHHADMNLTIMTYPEEISGQEYERYNKDMHEIVMARE